MVLLRWEEDVVPEQEGSEIHPGTSTDLTKAILSNPGQSSVPRLVIVDKFHSYVRPTWSPILTDFCTNFTGITQVRYFMISSPYASSFWKEVKMIS